MRAGRNYIDGVWCEGGGPEILSLNPATGEAIWSAKAATPDQVVEAFAAASAALPAWSSCPLAERIDILEAYAALVSDNKESLARAIAEDNGKPLWDARGEAGAVAAKVAISIRAYEERTGSRDDATGAVRTRLTHRPHGVMAVFGPYNFPAHLPNGHIVPALLAGNCVIFKPSSQTPVAAEVMLELWEKADLPAGVLNLLHGTREMANAIVAHPDLDGLLMTGSVPTGIALAKALAERPNVITAFEMGGNNPLIYWGAEDVAAAALLAVDSAFISAGQRCTCARRLILPEGAVGDDFLANLSSLMARLRIGPCDAEPEPYMGPLVSAAAVDNVLRAQEAFEKAGGTVLRHAERLGLGPAFVSPGLIDVSAIAKRPDEEVFGPLLQVIRVPDLEAAIAEANNTRYGLAAGLISDSEADYAVYHARIRAGVVNWNRPTTGASSALPFGGVGLSGNHRPAAYYAADYCAWPMASLEDAADRVQARDLPLGIEP